MTTAARVDGSAHALERIDSLDAARGLAVCGIVLLNVNNFSMPPAAYFNPLAYGYTGPETLFIWAMESILAQDAFRAIFAMLFGAGVAILFERGSTVRAHLTQMLVLLIIGHLHLVLTGDNVTYSIGRSVYGTSDPASDGFRFSVLTNGEMAAFYNFIAFLSALAMVPIIRKIGAHRTHAIVLVCGGIGMALIPLIHDKALLFAAAIGVGIAWGSIMGTPYVMLASCIPPRRTGVYMGIFNMMIVIPMLLNAATMLFYYEPLLGGDARNVLTLAGVLLLCAAFAVLRV